MLQLTEHSRSEPVALTVVQREKLREWFQAAFVPADNGLLHVIPGSRVGGAVIDGLKVSVAPKLPIHRLLTLISEIADPYGWLEAEAATTTRQDLDDAVVALFIQSCHRTFERGMHRAYRRERQRLNVIRGKLLVPQTLRQVGPVPVTVETDVFDDDTPENQVLAAALRQVRATPSLSDHTRQQAHHVLRDVRHVAPLRDPLATAKNIVWTRHNQWYQQAISLAMLLLSFGRVSAELGEETLPGFVIDMPKVIEQWVRVTLRRAWGVDEAEMQDSWKGALWLDEARRVELQPDLAIRRNGAWSFVGDVKYKILGSSSRRGSGPDRNDIYQMLAYLTATGLSEGTLIYAGVDGIDQKITVPEADKTVHLVTVNLGAYEARNLLIGKLGAQSPNG
ncbi:hypothetical protein GCM10023190_26340 [Enteractinococcus fodinae]|uniref:5-methylcytosine-specific restriction enzyme subunit McrC n=1 Tax=Enteractinococcus fodinae TaxID=684663 RepID=A0ABU2B1X5_9MICC|nr:hypothetical protein [Enteractinococcus fodinae]MDR7347602.1 5-methylcytosine-specific restriction enzyme subunit McrC [Enteractinococcus fodinae]